ncbi:MAG: winged helix-turn-helix transcriptional regulator [Anaerolineae bacterium]|nr:winged helix-turn-helix transcriptional regulator [Anaerolineae bacterium]
MVRARGLQVKLHLERLPQRLPAAVELALFRAVQTALRRAAHFAHASQVTVRMTGREDRVELAVFDNGHVRESTPELVASCQWIEQLGGHVTVGTGPLGGLQWAASFSLHPSATLTPREEKVLRLLSEGLSNKEIARALSISPRTVNFHLDNVYSKMGVHSRTEAVIHALRRGLIAQKPG